MANILDYLDWRGDLLFEDFPINEIDDLILARASYFPYDRIKLKKIENFQNISNKMKSFEEEKFSYHGDKDLVHKLGLSKRFKDCTITDYVKNNDTEVEKQFSAITIHINDKLHYVSFFGTDNSLNGWKEDFNLSYKKDIPAQLEAKKYLTKIASQYKGKLVVLGHSKGGNVAFYASIFAPAGIKKRIIKAISYDGPGFSKDVVNSDKYEEILPKLIKFIPQESIIGRCLYQKEKNKIVLSTEKGIYQHDIYSWQVLKDHFIEAKSTTKKSEILDKTVMDWLDECTPEQRKVFVDSIYEIITSTDVNKFKEFSKTWYKKIPTMSKTYKNLSEEDKKVIINLVKQFVTSYFKTLQKNRKKEEKSKKQLIEKDIKEIIGEE